MALDNFPLFPLQTVLFPGMLLPLHVFEERYRVMVKRCLAQDPRFGVVLIEEGREVGGPAVVHRIGTIARILKVSRYEDGRMDLLTVGQERFRILGTNTELPYMRAHIEVLPGPREPVEALREKAEEVRALLSQYWLLLEGKERRPPELPTDPVALSNVAGILDVELTKKQRLLESDPVYERLCGLVEHLRQEISLLRTVGPTRPVRGPNHVSRN